MKKCRARYGLEQQQLWSWNQKFSKSSKNHFFEEIILWLCYDAGVNHVGGKRNVWEFRCIFRAGICAQILFVSRYCSKNFLFRSIQEIEATRFDQEGKTVPASGQFDTRGGEDEGDHDGDENSPLHDAKGALESSLSSLGSPSPSLQSLPSPDQVVSSYNVEGDHESNLWHCRVPPRSPQRAPQAS